MGRSWEKLWAIAIEAKYGEFGGRKYERRAVLGVAELKVLKKEIRARLSAARN